MPFTHIRGLQPSKQGNVRDNKRQNRQTLTTPVTCLHKNIQKIVKSHTKTKQAIDSSSGSNNIMDQKCYQFYLSNFLTDSMHTRLSINTQECSMFLSRYNVVFINERTQEITNSKVLITNKTNRKKNSATFVVQLPPDYCSMLVVLILIKIDFANIQIELSAPVGRNFQNFMLRAKNAGFKFYYDFIRLNTMYKRVIVIRTS